MYVCVCMNARMNLCGCIQECAMYVCMYVCIFALWNICMYVCWNELIM